MSVVDVDKIIKDVVSSFAMEKLTIPNNVVMDIKDKYVKKENTLVKKRRFFCYDFRRK